MKEYDIFVSYSRKDSVIVQSIVDRLKTEGYSCWMDVSGIESGDAFKHVIVNAIKNSRLVLFFSSIAANESNYTVKEINVAVELGKPIIPFKIDDAPYADSIMFDLSGLDYVAHTERGHIDRLLKTLRIRCKFRDGVERNIGEFVYKHSPLPNEPGDKIRKSLLLRAVDEASNHDDVHCDTTTSAYGHAAGVDVHDITEIARLQELDNSIRHETGKTIVGNYEIVRLLKYGGRSVVYKAQDKNNGENLILKIALVDTCLSPSDFPMPLWKRIFRFGRAKRYVQDKFDAIAEVYRRLMNMGPQHPNLVTIRKFEEDRRNGRYYVAEDFVDGASLVDVIHILHSNLWGMSVPPNAINNVVTSGFSILEGVAAGLDFLHQNGVVHCDIKPDNVMVDRNGVPLITDFGEARVLWKSEIIQVGKLDVLGITPVYMAPEQWARTVLDPRTDQYSLGVIAYQMIFQRLPFDSKNFSELRDSVMFEEVPISPICPWPIRDCLKKALAKKRSDRYSSCSEFVTSLRHAIDDWLPAC